MPAYDVHAKPLLKGTIWGTRCQPGTLFACNRDNERAAHSHGKSKSYQSYVGGCENAIAPIAILGGTGKKMISVFVKY